MVQVDGELMSYNGKQTAAGTEVFDTETSPQPGLLLNVQRGLQGTTPAVHHAGAPVILVTPACTGDCDDNHTVTVDEILTMVNIALGNADISTCFAGDANVDQQITVDEILMAVNNALNGC